MRYTRKLFAAAAVTAFTATSPAAWASLVTNGGFEADVISGTGYNYVPTLTGWMGTGAPNGFVLFDSTYHPVAGGAQALQLEFVGNYIEQMLTTVVGQTYELSFDLASYLPPGVSILDVDFGSLSMSVPDAGGGAYTPHTLQFTATSSSTLLRFENAGGVPGVAGFTYTHLDNISVTQVPEPGALALVGIALLGAAASRRRSS